MSVKDNILQGALKLPAEERLEVAERLFESVEGEEGAEEAWAKEIARRIEAIDAGRVRTMAWEEGRKQIVE